MKLILIATTAVMLAATGTPSELSPARRQQIVATYHELAGGRRIEARPLAKLPKHETFVEVDVSPRIRSASFGHKTTLLVPVGTKAHPSAPDAAKEFYVKFGRSTNTPERLFGPFTVEAKGAE